MNKLFKTFKYRNKHKTVITSTDHQLKENKHTSDTVIFGQMSPKNPMRENRCSYSKGLLLCSISLSTTECLTGSPDKEKYTAAIPLYPETGIQKTCPTKPSPAQLKLSVGPSGLCISPRTLCVSALRHCAAYGSLCVTPSTLYVDDAVSIGSTLPLLGSASLRSLD